ncbi:MAG: translation initiation factor IF-2 [Rickettsiales bacterium]|nr:translation initiation factor IF-2 [Rickettsiales bacterium]
MTDQSGDNKRETLTVNRPNKLSLTKTVESGKVKQNFTHGRSKTVTVEVRKTRSFARSGTGMVEVENKSTPRPQPAELKNITPPMSLHDMQVRDKSQIDAASREVRSPQEEERRRLALNARNAASETDNSARAETPVRGKSSATVETAAPMRGLPLVEHKKLKDLDSEIKTDKTDKKKIRLKGDNERRSSNKITVAQALEYQEERMRSLASIKRQREKARMSSHGSEAKDKVVREVVIPETITVQELANRMAERAADVIKTLMKMGTIAAASQSIDADTAELIVSEFGHNFKRVTEADVENVLIEDTETTENLKPRAPVVTIMGHVDHGKTSLLDALRNANVVSGEAGGITQHIGAYQVEMNGQKVTFLDTPGHEAFTAMRSRGAKATDIVVLVVAADDGIMAQTQEAISHAKAAGVPIIVAVNKIDKPGADVQRVKTELMNYELVPEEFGGDTQVIEVSAKERLNLDKLIEGILLQAEVLELTANPERKGAGVVIEAQIDKGKGVLATFLVQRGTLVVGDLVVAGSSWGRVRALTDDKGQVVKSAVPSQPVEVLGLSEAPMAGDEFSVVENEKTARDIVEYRQSQTRSKQVVVASRTLEQLFANAQADAAKELPLIIKGDVQGSVEAIAASVQKFNGPEVTVRVLLSGVGAITESDVTLANTTGGIILAFNVRPTAKAREMAMQQKIDIRYYSVIYELVDQVKAALSGLLSPERRENFIGYAEIRQVFNITKVGKVAGCYVTEGTVKRGAGVRLLRDNVVIHEGKLKTLKRFKDEVKDVQKGYECGMAFENYDDVREGDVIEAFEIQEIARTVS